MLNFPCRLNVIGITKDRRDRRQREAQAALDQARRDAAMEEEYDRRVLENRARRGYERTGQIVIRRQAL